MAGDPDYTSWEYISMRTRTLVAAASLVAALIPAPAFAWGTSVHRFIIERAIELLPPELKPLFVRFHDELVVRVVDPDVWRTAGWDDGPSHFVDFGVPEFGPFPFTALPREYGAAIEKFGAATLRRDGILPWREAEQFGNLRRAFEAFRGEAPFEPADAILFAAVASHYIQDAHQPLHATNNYDGQLSGQFGIHARFETALFDRYRDRLSIHPPPMQAIANPRDTAFDILLASYQLVPAVLDADKAAVAGKETYDNEYFEKFFGAVKPILERRIGESIAASASIIVGAWEAAGRPELNMQKPRRVEKVRPPR
jgi:hypothetical protein